GRSSASGARVMYQFNQGPITIYNNQTETFNFLITQFSNTYQTGTGVNWQIKIIKNSCLDYAGNMRIVHHSGSPVWNPSNVLFSGDTIIGIFAGNPLFNLTNAELIFDLTANCNNCNGGGITNLQIQSFIVPTTSCNCEALINCFTYPVEVLCPQNCDGFNMTDFEVKRINFGLPDNNNDGLPDNPPASLNMNFIRADRAMFNDTILAVYKGKINAISQSSWNNLFAITRITGYGIGFTITEIQYEVFRNNVQTSFSVNNISYQQDDSVNTRRFLFNLSSNQLANTGSFPFNFQYFQDDSVVLKVRYVISNNLTSTLINCQFLNEFYTSNSVNPFDFPQYG
ncbi:MAG: hypothetical protein ACK4ON_14605, partial [Bacteroidia bacterium]